MKSRHACVHKADHLTSETSHWLSEMVLIAHGYTMAPKYAFQITWALRGKKKIDETLSFLICPTHLRAGVISLLNLPCALDLWCADADNRWNLCGLVAAWQPICQHWRVFGLVPEYLRVSSECLDPYFIHQACSLQSGAVAAFLSQTASAKEKLRANREETQVLSAQHVACMSKSRGHLSPD